MTSFNVTSLDLSGVTDEDLASSSPDQVRYLRKPGKYEFTIDSIEEKDMRTDAAGKQWGNILLRASTSTDEVSDLKMSGFISVPVETLIYTGKSGNESKIKTRIFSSLVSSVTGNPISTSELPSIIGNLGDILAPGATFTATVNYRADRVIRNDENDYRIALVVGGNMVDEDGDEVSFADYDGAKAHYRSIKGFDPARGLEFISFLAPTSQAKSA